MRTVFQGGVLALDVASKRVGAAFGDAESPSPRCLTWKLPGCADDDALTRSCAGLYGSVSEICKLVHPKIVAIEAPFNPRDRDAGYSNHRSVTGLFSLVGCARAAGHNAGARVVLGHIQSWRKTFCGRGNPENPKQATLDRCKLLGWTVNGEDEADAAGLWAHFMSLNFPKWAPHGTVLFGRTVANPREFAA